MRNSVIILAGGSGKRMGSGLPKQFLEIHGKTILQHSIEKFLDFDPSIEIVLVINEEYIDFWSKIENDLSYSFRHVPGGNTRFQSVKNGISVLEGESLVGIHDAVRPVVSVATIESVYMAAEIIGGAIPCIPLKESVREVDGDNSRPLDRSLIQIVQTPQVFRSGILRKSYETEYKPDFTDDASVVEAAGFKVALVQGDEYNIKITTPDDLEIARLFLNSQMQHPQ